MIKLFYNHLAFIVFINAVDYSSQFFTYLFSKHA